MTYKPKYLGKKGSTYKGLDAIPTTNQPHRVTMTSDEVTAMCPLTGQPDFYTVSISYEPSGFICESKSLKLYFASLRNKGIFAESLAIDTAKEFFRYVNPFHVKVVVEQKPRGGIGITATADWPPQK